MAMDRLIEDEAMVPVELEQRKLDEPIYVKRIAKIMEYFINRLENEPQLGIVLIAVGDEKINAYVDLVQASPKDTEVFSVISEAFMRATARRMGLCEEVVDAITMADDGKTH